VIFYGRGVEGEAPRALSMWVGLRFRWSTIQGDLF
jgi:hypothetical protein